MFQELSTRVSVIERKMGAITSRRLQALQERLTDLSTVHVPQRLARVVLQRQSSQRLSPVLALFLART